jgi:hypothetical protein
MVTHKTIVDRRTRIEREHQSYRLFSSHWSPASELTQLRNAALPEGCNSFAPEHHLSRYHAHRKIEDWHLAAEG